jgi:hypothetical protein
MKVLAGVNKEEVLILLTLADHQTRVQGFLFAEISLIIAETNRRT